MTAYHQKVNQAAAHIRKDIVLTPRIALLTGTGLGDSAAGIDIESTWHYDQIPHFPRSTVESHKGRLILGRLGSQGVVALQGRFHLYEGYTPLEVTFPIRVLQTLGIKTLVLTNAAGGMNSRYEAGDVMVITDHINLTGANPLIGSNKNDWGIRFPDMINAYDPGLRQRAAAAAESMGIGLKAGVYAGLTGPSLETPAEIRFLKTIGADAVGFSTVQEVIAAIHAGMRVLGLSTITNINNPDNPQPATLEEIIAVAQNAAPKLEALIAAVVASLSK